ncbi:MAG: TonB-dependent receptor plug domain-containing protein [Ginsengibacter sp.]
MVCAILFASKAFSQTADSLREISLPAIIIKAFEQNRKLKDVPAAVSYIGRKTLDNFSTSSIVSAVNTTPGVKMEERSPGSYRINIRGSSLRSPFGVRNVKIYYNDIPFTDPGGDSYLNQLGSYNINSIEIIKGSNNSIYGAGTGGAMLIESISERDQPGLYCEYGLGSYGSQNYNTSLTTASDNSIVKYGFQHQKSDGYRDHSRSQKSVASWNGLFKMGKESLLKTTFLFGDLFYETPGALTKAEYNANPKAARPGTLSSPGAVQANAYIKQKMFLTGASYERPITSNLQNKTTLYGMFTELINPNLRNYEKSSRPHFGTRTIFKFQQPFKNVLLNIDGGGEYQQGFTSVNIHKTINGNADSLRSHDEINNRQSMVFLQASLDVKDWTIIGGASWNTLQVRFQRFIPASLGKQSRLFNNQVAPRFSLMKKFKQVNIYASIARGFSPPTTDELLPTGGAINLGLNAEEGTNYDLGVKGTFFNSMYVDINLFTFSLNNTIVQRRDASGGNFFINAGKTKQHGIETLISYPLLFSSTQFKKSTFWISHTWHDFHYKEFKQLANDFSGNRLPSVPQNTISSGIDILLNNGLGGGINYFYSDKIPLNDANSDYAKSYHLLGAKIGFEMLFKNRTGFKISIGADNLLNENYSLGNDINGFGGRYYNAAALRNFYISLVFRFNGKKNQ